MKVFWLSKFTNEKPLPLYRSLLDQNSIYSINIVNSLPFDCLIFTNPKNSNLIYILNNLYFTSYECTNLKLYMADDINLALNSKNEEFLDINCVNHIDESNMTELYSITCPSNLLSDHYVIIIPGGSIIIKSNLSILNTELSISYTTELL